MACFFCDGCGQNIDIDFDGYNETNGKEYCDSCYDELDELPEIKPIPLIKTRPVFKPISREFGEALGSFLNEYGKERGQLTDEEKKIMEDNFRDSAIYLEIK